MGIREFRDTNKKQQNTKSKERFINFTQLAKLIPVLCRIETWELRLLENRRVSNAIVNWENRNLQTIYSGSNQLVNVRAFGKKKTKRGREGNVGALTMKMVKKM